MDFSNVKSLEQLADYMRDFINSEENATGFYDFDGVVNLLGALLDNIRSRAVGEDMETLGRLLTPRQASTLIHMARVVRR